MNKTLRKMIWLMTISIIVVAMLAACGSNNSGNVNNSNNNSDKGVTTPKDSDGEIELRFVWWGSQDRHDRTLKVIDLFEDKHPNVKISPEFTGGDEIFQRLATMAAGNNLPDIVQMDIAIFAEYIERGLLRPLDEFIDSGLINMDDVHESFIQGGKLKDEIYGVIIGTTALAVVFDPEMYERANIAVPEPGYTWDDFIGQAYELKAALGDEIQIRGLTGIFEFTHYLRGHGQSLYSEDGKDLGFDEQHLVDFFAMWKKMIDDGISPTPAVTNPIQGIEDELIVHGLTPVYSTQQPRITFHSNQFIALSQAAGRTLDMTIYPNIEGGDLAHYVKPSQFLSMSSNTKHPEMVAKFIDFFTNSLEANEILNGERGVPISSKVREHLLPSMAEPGKKMFEYMDTLALYSGSVPSFPPGDSAVMDEYNRTYEELAFGVIDAQTAAKRFMKEAREILSKNE